MNFTFISHSSLVGELLCEKLFSVLVGEQEEPQIRTGRNRGAAAMASGILVNIKEEVSCPICLELLKEPLSLDCGHSFCQACITANNKESMMGQEGESHCPVCRLNYQPGNLRLNRHVANIVEMLREVRLIPEEEQKRNLCVRHGERLLLFCKEDGKIICWLCERSQEHRGHHTFLMEEVAQEYKEKLQRALEKLRENKGNAEKWEADLKEERISCEDQIENESQHIQHFFKQLRGFLDIEELKEMEKLEKKKENILNDLAQSESELVKHSQLLRDFMSDLEYRLQGSTVEMMQDVNGIMERSETFILKKPEALYEKQRSVFQAPDLREMLQAFAELTAARCYWVYITLNLPKNNPDVAISEDRREVRVLHWNTNVHEADYDVLGSPVITSGKHYWEVDVSDKHAWILGVCCVKHNYFSFHQDYSRYQPRLGYWVIGLQNNSEYKAFLDLSNYWGIFSSLVLTVPPRRVGVFLDYNAGTVSFFNVTNYGDLIYKFSSCCFSQEVYPFFNPLHCTGCMTLCSPSS
ncbi:LOW QUALITY PROTEIN: tripartite motif-containing protein 5-like [Molossus molossus]|nr:LOW QUALITY PROTEIN: tripartite motif-containing protein 5-like [Molossus molossus]